jgi:hypothetical protein
MLQIKFRVLVTALSLIAAATAHAETKSLVKKNNFFENATNSPWFNLGVDGVTTYGPSQDINSGDHTQGHTVTFKPNVTGVQAGQVSSVTLAGNFSIQGWATAGNNFNDLNGIPEGITMTFKTAMTFSVDAGNYLTLSSTAANGLGIAQLQGTAGTLDVGETLHVSDIQVTDINFTGSVPGYTFSNPTITNFGTLVLRSGAGTDFTEASESAGLYSVPPDGSGNPTIGFGDGVNGTGVVQSNVKIDNGFEAAGTNFTNRYLGAWDFKMLAGAMSLKGVGFQYELGYDIVAAPVNVPGDYNQNGVVDAADYVLWRKGDLAADSNGDTVVDQVDYDFWRARFENTAGAGAGLSGTSVPEPATLMLVVVGMLATCSWRRFGRMRS